MGKSSEQIKVFGSMYDAREYQTRTMGPAMAISHSSHNGEWTVYVCRRTLGRIFIYLLLAHFIPVFIRNLNYQGVTQESNDFDLQKFCWPFIFS